MARAATTRDEAARATDFLDDATAVFPRVGIDGATVETRAVSMGAARREVADSTQLIKLGSP
tara:strand:+ start:1030 stop:1215 length:186 start_codon:yes stop_codon:yes gene_type:complete